MKQVKWLYAVFFALTFTLCVEITGSFSISKGLIWYKALAMPSFTLAPQVHSGIWCAVYIAETLIISSLIVSGEFKPFVYEFIGLKFAAALWTVIFFGFKAPLASLVIMTVILTVSFKYFKSVTGLHRHKVAAAGFFPILIWYCYLWILNYCAVLLN